MRLWHRFRHGRTASIYNLLSQAGRFGLSAEEARAEIDRLVDVVRHWRDSFFACGVSAKDIDYIAPAILPDCFFFDRRPDAFTAALTKSTVKIKSETGSVIA